MYRRMHEKWMTNISVHVFVCVLAHISPPSNSVSLSDRWVWKLTTNALARGPKQEEVSEPTLVFHLLFSLWNSLLSLVSWAYLISHIVALSNNPALWVSRDPLERESCSVVFIHTWFVRVFFAFVIHSYAKLQMDTIYGHALHT